MHLLRPIGFIFACLAGLLVSPILTAQRPEVNLCEIVDKDNLVEFRKQIKKLNIGKKARLYMLFECSKNYRFEGGNLLKLAISSGSYKIASYLIKIASKSSLKAKDEEGMNMLDWANHYYADAAASEAIIAKLKTKFE